MNRPRLIAMLLLAAISLAHAAGLWSIYANSPSGPFNSAPIIEQDYAQHFHHVISARAFWERDGRLWGYNPYFLGGYLSNTIQDVSIKLPEIVAAVSTPLNPILVFNVVVYLMAALTPVALAAGFWGMFCAWGGLGARRGIWAVAAAGIATAAWWNGYPREMFFYGMIGFPPGCALTVAWLGLWIRRIESGDRGKSTVRGLAALAVVAALLPCVHLQAAGWAGLLTLGLMAVHPARRNAARWMELAGVAAISFAANAIWLVPMIRYSGGSTFSKIAAEFAFFASDDPLTFAKAYLPWGSYFSFRQNPWPPLFRLALLMLAGVGVRGGFRRGPKSPSLKAWAVFGVATFFFTYFGSFIGAIRAIQPLRFEVLLDFLLAPLAIVAVAGIWHRPAAVRAKIQLCFCVLIVIAGVAAGTANIALTERAGFLKLRYDLTPSQMKLTVWIADRVVPGARVLFEESGDETGFVYDGSYLSAFVPHMTGHSAIGGPANFYNDPAGQTNFHSGMLMGRPIESFSDTELRDIFERYNIGGIVAFAPRSVARFSRLEPTVELDRVEGPVSLFLVRGAGSWFLEGSGEVTASLNRIEVERASGERVVLKFHWYDGLVADPPVEIRPRRVGDDPIPFIEVVKPPTSFEIRMR